jgi:hypothetical protein
VTCEFSTHLGVRLRVVVNGHMDGGQRKELMLLIPFGTQELKELGHLASEVPKSRNVMGHLG